MGINSEVIKLVTPINKGKTANQLTELGSTMVLLMVMLGVIKCLSFLIKVRIKF